MEKMTKVASIHARLAVYEADQAKTGRPTPNSIRA